MRRRLTSAILALAACGPALAADEPRPFYGATVTVEHGVRVYRSLPPHRDIIIAPDEGPKVDVHLWRGGEAGARSESQRRGDQR